MYTSSDRVLTVKTDNEGRKRSRVKVSVGIRSGKIGPTRWASSVRPELGAGWAIKLLAKKNRANLIRSGSSEFFLPSKCYLAQPARFLGRTGLLKFWPEKTGPMLARPDFDPAHRWPGRLPALVGIAG